MMTEKRREVPEYGYLRVWTGRYITQASCDKCSHWNDLTDNFCTHCGSPFKAAAKKD